MRKHYLDNGKAIASLLGFFYHVGLIFSVPWLIHVDSKDFNGSIYFITQFLSLFRMPLFMFISGYFALHAVKKYSTQDFTRSRLLRLGVPMITTLFTLVALQYIYLDVLNNQRPISEALSKVIPWSDSFSMSHLWFLYLVIIYSFLLYLTVKIIKKFNNFFFKYKKIIGHMTAFKADALLLTFLLGSSFVFVAASQVSPINSSLLPLHNFGVFLPYFVMGVITYAFWDIFNTIFIDISKKRVITILILLMLSALPLFIPSNRYAIDLFFKSIASYFSLVLVIFLLFNLFNKTNRVLKYLADSSYAIYLFHQPVLVIVAYYYLSYIDSPSFLSYLIIIGISIAITYTLEYLIVRKSRSGKFLFTGVVTK